MGCLSKVWIGNDLECNFLPTSQSVKWTPGKDPHAMLVCYALGWILCRVIVSLHDCISLCAYIYIIYIYIHT